MLKPQTKHHHTSVHSNQQGFASLVIGLVLIVVLALLTVGFAQLTRHEEQQALSKQLASQAYYAAETGINDVVKAVNAGTLDPTTITPGSCATIPGVSPDIDVANGVKYSCVLVDLKTPDLFYQVGTDQGQSVVTSIGPVSFLTITWNSHNMTRKNFPAFTPAKLANGFGTSASWVTDGYPAVIQFSLTPLGTSGAVVRNSLLSQTFSTFLYPSTGGSNSVTYNPPQAPKVSGKCDKVPASPTFGKCSAVITMAGAGTATTQKYLLHFLSLYDASDITVTGTLGAGPGATPSVFEGGQMVVDVTGKARNVLKRLQVRVPLNGSDAANYVLEGKNICKRMATEQGNSVFYDFNNNLVSADSSPDACAADPIITAPTPPGDGAAAIGDCQKNCTNDGNPEPGHYGWKHSFTNASPANQNPRIAGCTWTVAGDGLSGSVPLESGSSAATGACGFGAVTNTFDFHTILGINDATYPAYPAGCHNYRLVLTLTITFNDGTPAAKSTKNFNEPACIAGP